MEVFAKVGQDGAKQSVNFEVGKELDAMVKKFGADVVYDKARANMVVGLQSVVRSAIDAGTKGADLQKVADSWVPGIRKAAKPKTEKLKEEYANLSDEQKQELLAMINDI